MDDLIVPSEDCEDGLKRLRRVLELASDCGLNINWKKCQFLKTKVEFLGHIVEANSLQPLEYKTNAVMKFPKSISVKHVQSFFGLTGYFQKFINNYLSIVRWIFWGRTFQFDEKEKFAFEQLKSALASKPVLQLHKVDAYTELYTDASKYKAFL